MFDSKYIVRNAKNSTSLNLWIEGWTDGRMDEISVEMCFESGH